MDASTFENILQNYINFIESNKQELILNIVWHGGEPLVAGLDYYKKMMEIENRYSELNKDANIKIFNYLQTNATLIDNEWINFFKDNKFSLGISLDGPKYIHNKYRKFIDDNGTFDVIIENIRKLQEEHVPIGILSVITKFSSNFPEDIFNFFVDKLKIKLIDFIPCFYNNDELSPSSDDLSRFLIKIFDLWYSINFSCINIITLSDIIDKTINWHYNIEQPDKYICEFSGNCGRNLAILSNGDIYPCECLVNVGSLKLGNINQNNFIDIICGDQFSRFKNLCSDISVECMKCVYFSICKGGCFHRRINGWTINEKREHYCNARKEIINHIINTLFKGSIPVMDKIEG
ncbi:hypothetical protein BFT35_12800 [Thermoanaerobacterium thermosaccharolyticum]|nr:hypothetical protein BFT35_12800 [Thermoanaerobacterium thermosaccharolyticum]